MYIDMYILLFASSAVAQVFFVVFDFIECFLPLFLSGPNERERAKEHSMQNVFACQVSHTDNKRTVRLIEKRAAPMRPRIPL